MSASQEPRRRKARRFLHTPSTSRWMLDACSFGGGDALQAADVEYLRDRIGAILEQSPPPVGRALEIMLPEICRRQLDNAPRDQRLLASNFLYTATTPSNDNHAEHASRLNLRAELRGDAQSDKHDPDADALFEAIKYGFDIFVTNDRRLLRRASKITGIAVLSPRQMMDAIRTNTWPEDPK